MAFSNMKVVEKMDDGSFVFQGQGTLYNQTGQSVYQVYGKTEPVPEMEPHGLKMVRSTLEIGLMITRMEKGPTFFPD